MRSTSSLAAAPAADALNSLSSSAPSRSLPVAAPDALDFFSSVWLESVPPRTSSIQDAGFIPCGSFLPCVHSSDSMYVTKVDAGDGPSGPKYTCHPPRCKSKRSSNMRKISREGW